ncbi:MAG: ABC transporter permease [Candidatus Aminicenantes bacterium]|nr:ABC transporter permease [Candidatus Aminicenantes bacterium]
MRIFHLARKEFIEILRQRQLLIIMFIAPLIQIIMLGYVATTDVKNIPVDIINLSHNKAARKVITRIRSSPLFRVRHIDIRSTNAIEPLKRGDVKAVIVFKDNQQKAAGPVSYPEVQILMDGIDATTSGIAAGYFNGIIKKFILTDISRFGLGELVEIRPLIRFNPDLRSINYMGPGIVAFLLTIITLFLASVSLVREKTQQTMDTLLISRLTSAEIYIGKALPVAVIGLFEMTIGITAVVLWFGIPVRGNLFHLFLAALIFLPAILSYAFLISTFSSTPQQALFFSWFSMVVFLLLSGFFTPVENIPRGLRLLADINPLRYLIRIIREIFLKGNGIAYFAKDLLILAAIAVVIMFFSTVNFKKFISR